jgi:hypothetical protein
VFKLKLGAMAKIATDLEKLQQVLSESLLSEWEAQGHSMTGKVVKDIKYETKQTADTLELSGFMYPYANYQAHGAKWPNKRPPIEPLQRFVKLRMGITDEKKSKSIAFAIATKLKKEGLPSSGGMRFSKTGKRDKFIEEAFKKNEEKITEAISDMAFNRLSVQFDVLINKWNIELNK